MKKKKVIKIVAAVLVILYVVLFLVIIFPKYVIGDKSDNPKNDGTATILKLWHVDVFEGGSGSRSEFLRRIAVSYEKTTPNTFIMVESLTSEQIVTYLQEGKSADLISYGAGLANTLLPELQSFTGTFVANTTFVDSGVVENNVYGVPWSTGAYVIAGLAEHLQDNNAPFIEIISSKNKESKKSSLYSFTYGQAQYNNPLLGLVLSKKDITLTEKSVNTAVSRTQSQAYAEFISKSKSVFLLGTQRDVVKLGNRENSSDFLIEPLGFFTDLVNYISIGKNSKSDQSIKFIEFLMHQNQQQKMSEINMFSTVIENVYSSGIMSDIEKTISNSIVPNAYTDPLIIQETRAETLLALNGNSDALKKLRANYN